MSSSAWSNLAGLTEESLRGLQARALAKYFRLILSPFHPFTREFFQAYKLDSSGIGSIKDLQKLPYLSKKDMMSTQKEPEKFRQFIVTPAPEDFRRYWPLHSQIPVLFAQENFRRSFHPVLLTATTGRTADPISFVYAQRDMDVLALAGRRLIEAFGLAYPDRALSFFPYAPHLAFWQCTVAGFAAKIFMVQTGGGKVVGTEGNLKMLDKIKPTAIIGVPSYTYHVLREAVAAKISLAPVKKVILGAEKVLPGLKRKLIALLEEGGAKEPVIFSTYAFTEAKKAWGECPTKDPDVSSGYHLTPDLDLIQIADPITGKIMGPETPGEIIYTPMTGAGTQVWRYRTGDISEGGITYRPCPHCGRSTPRLLGPISRVSNVKDLRLTKIKGTLVNLNNVSGILDETPLIEEWQIEIRKKDNDPHEVDEVAVYVAVKTGAREAEVVAALGKNLRASCEISPNEITVLPLADMLDRVKMETALKEVRILDRRGK